METINHIIIVDSQARIRRKPNTKAKMVARMYIWENRSIEEVMEQYDLTPMRSIQRLPIIMIIKRC